MEQAGSTSLQELLKKIQGSEAATIGTTFQSLYKPRSKAEIDAVLRDDEERRREKMSVDEWIRTLQECGIEKRYWSCTFEKILASERNGELDCQIERAITYANNFEKYLKKGIGILFIGPVGTMKTSLAVAIAQKLIQEGRSVFFVPLAELFDKISTMYRSKDQQEYKAYQDKLKTAQLLIIDDMGAEYPSDWIRNKVDAMISARYNRMLPIVITSNLAPGEISGQYRERVYDRLRGTSIVIKMATKESKRQLPQEF